MQTHYGHPKPLPEVPADAENLGYLQYEFMIEVAQKMGINGIDRMTFREISDAIKKKDAVKHGQMVRRNDVIEKMYYEFKRLKILKSEYDTVENAILFDLDGDRQNLELNIFGIKE